MQIVRGDTFLFVGVEDTEVLFYKRGVGFCGSGRQVSIFSSLAPSFAPFCSLRGVPGVGTSRKAPRRK